MGYNRGPNKQIPTDIATLKRIQKHTLGKDNLLTKWCYDNYKSTSKMKLNAGLTPRTKTHSKYIKKNISERSKILKQQKENKQKIVQVRET